jgi:transcriptional regulator with XRE-family HTH domain
MRSLREWRAERLLSTKRLSTLTGVSNKTILDIEHQKRMPTFKTIQKLSEALNIDPKEVSEFAEAIARRSQTTSIDGANSEGSNYEGRK